MTMTPSTPVLRVRIFPETGWAAMAAHEEVVYITWAALAVLDPTGSGKVVRTEAREFIADWRGIDARSIRRIHADGECRGYWTTSATRDGTEHIFLTSIARLMVRFGLDSERAPRRVPLASIQTPAAMRAALYASVHELPGHAGRFRNAPLARATTRELTGVPETTQRRYDKHATELIQSPVVRFDSSDPVRLHGQGYFVGRDGTQYRRLPDYRLPVGQWSSSKTAANHALEKARGLRERGGSGAVIEPVVDFRGQSAAEPGPPPRSRRTYVGSTEVAALKRARRAHARGRVMLAWGYAGAMEFRSVEL